jgi:RND family efflux transporter MFP subunit
MKQYAILTVIFLLTACSAGKKETAGSLTDKKAQLTGLKKERDALNEKISALEQEIMKLDPETAAEKVKLVEVTSLVPQNFQHFIDLQGKIATENIYYVSPRGMGGQVSAIYVKQGDLVKKGQLLLKLDDAIIQQNIRQLETQLAFARNLYERQKTLWNDGIGTEVQYLTAKNNVDNLEKQIDVVKEQLNNTKVFSQVSGIAETVNIRVGETFTGSPVAGITIVNPSNLKATVDVPENYVSRIRRGMPVVVDVPDIGKSFNTAISLISETINVTNRSFVAESKVPSDPNLKPNQIAVVRILDHEAKNAIVIPVATIQSDEKGKYVYVESTENGKKIARKKPVTIGELYNDMIEVKSGLVQGDRLVTKGFQSLYEGQSITTDVN